MKQVKFDENRTYGIEIEVTNEQVNYTPYAIEIALQHAGINASSEYYNHNTCSYWKIITDASCGYEIVSPVLKGYEGLEQIKTVCKTLNEMGCKVNKKCGLHIHHGVEDFTLKTFKNLFILYGKYEEAIDSIMPESRRKDNARYCRSMIRYNNYEEYVQLIEQCKSVDQIIYDVANGDRYRKLNVKPFVVQGTIEFRQHSGTIDADKIINWLMLNQAMIVKAKAGGIVKAKEKEYNEIGYLLHVLGILRKTTCTEELYEMGKFFKKRMRQLNKEMVMAA